MKRKVNITSLKLTIVAALVPILCVLPAATFGVMPIEAGYAALDLTPDQSTLDEGDVFMGGYGRWTERGAATGIHDPLTARSLCIRVEGQALCMAAVDSLGLPGVMHQAIGRKVSAETGLDTDRIFVSATHTHAAPDLLGLWGGSPRSYSSRVVDVVARSLTDAYEALEPVDAEYASEEAPAHNRRGWGFTDSTLTVIALRRRADGIPKAVLVAFAAHPVISRQVNRQLSSDFVHYLRADLEDRIGAPVVYVNGAIGDVNPHQRLHHDDPWGAAELYGSALADASMAALKRSLPVIPSLEVRTLGFTARIENRVLVLAHLLGLMEDDTQGPFWDLSVRSKLRYFRLGSDIEGWCVPGEPLTRTGLAMKDRLEAPTRILIGLCGGTLGYFIREDEWETGRNGNYEESVSLGPRIGEQLIDLAGKLVSGKYLTPID